MTLKDMIALKVPARREQMSRIVKEFGPVKVCDVTVEQLYGGIRGVMIQVSDVSYVDPIEGIRLRGYTIPEIIQLLPKPEGAEYPFLGGLYYLLMADELPTRSDALAVEADWKRYGEVPGCVFDVLKAMSPDAHPMALFSTALLAMQNGSIFSSSYKYGLPKQDYWEMYYEDSIRLTARLPEIAAYIYNLKYRDGKHITPDPTLDWAANFAHMIGHRCDTEYQDLCRLFFLLHSDHEGANVSAHTSWLVASALSDVYYASSAGLNGLAGPLHGLANQECLRWLLGVKEHFGTRPNQADLAAFLEEEFKKGRVIPGYGHAVLRATDPRFTAQLEFAMKYLPEDELIQLVTQIYEVLPPILKASGKVKNPWPNVDAINGALQYHYGVTQFDFYTVLFGVSRILGLTTHAVWARAVNKPIERPKSLTTPVLEQILQKGLQTG